MKVETFPSKVERLPGEEEAAVHNVEQFRSKVESGNLISNSLNKGRNFSIKSRTVARGSGSYS